MDPILLLDWNDWLFSIFFPRLLFIVRLLLWIWGYSETNDTTMKQYHSKGSDGFPRVFLNLKNTGFSKLRVTSWLLIQRESFIFTSEPASGLHVNLRRVILWLQRMVIFVTQKKKRDTWLILLFSAVKHLHFVHILDTSLFFTYSSHH